MDCDYDMTFTVCSQENGNAVPSMLHSMLEAIGEDTDSYRRRVIANAAAAAYEGKTIHVTMRNAS